MVGRVPGELPGHLVLSVQVLSRLRLCDPMHRSTPGLPVQGKKMSPQKVEFVWRPSVPSKGCLLEVTERSASL